MRDYKTFFKGKRITMLGLGLLGRGVNVAKFLSGLDANLTITDLKSAEELKESLDQLRDRNNIRYALGDHNIKDFQHCDMIVKAAGVPLDSPYVAEAHRRGIPIEMDASLFARFSPATIIGVTGTRGKSTVTHLLVAMLKRAKAKVYIGGNVRGLATLPLLKQVKKGDIVVLELDSWQLQGFGESQISPHIAVFTNFLPDHLNYYKGSMQKYFSDKANIFKFQKKGDWLVTNTELAKKIKKQFPKLPSKIVVAEKLPKDFKLGLLGEHNQENAALTRAAAHIAGVSESDIKKTLADFKGVSGRLELVKSVSGVKWYNDTTATSPEAVLAAIKTLGSKKKIFLIFGGADKKLPMEKLLAELPKYVKAIAFLPGSGSDIVRPELQKIKNLVLFETASLKEAVEKAAATAKRGESVALSPGFASFGIFKNEFDRGEQFEALVKNLKSKK